MLPKPPHLHAIAAGIIAVQLCVLGILAQRQAPDSTATEKPRSPTSTASEDAAAPAGAPSKKLQQLRAQCADLQQQILNLRRPQSADLVSGKTVLIPTKFFQILEPNSPLTPLAHGLRDSLMITEDEARQIEIAADATLARLNEVERSNLRIDTGEDGSPVYTISASPTTSAPLMEELTLRLSTELGDERGQVIANRLRNTRFLHSSQSSFRLRAAKVTDDPLAKLSGRNAPTPKLAMEVVDPDGDTDTQVVRSNYVQPLLERFGQVLGVNSEEALNQLFQVPAED